MIIYSANKDQFCDDVFENRIEKVILEKYTAKLGGTSPSEIRSWKNSLQYMERIVNTPAIPNDAMVAIEYQIPSTGRKIDFILSGQNEENNDCLVIVELKQWEKAEKTQLDAIVRTFVGKAFRDVSHPSYQAWTYAALLNNFNEFVQKQKIIIRACAYLHNAEDVRDLRDDFYKEHLKRAPLFSSPEARKLQDFIQANIKYGDKNKIIYEIDKSRIVPSKSLADELDSMLKGNEEFLMIDDQKLVFETARHLAHQSSSRKKNVLIVQGGPGSGKTVVAINLLVNLINEKKNTKYITKNAAPRAVYEEKLTGSFKKSHISNLFDGSGKFTNSPPNLYDVLIVDEAHRLNAKSGMMSNLGENQVKEIINASTFSVFFIDEDQKVTFKDIGNKEEIEKWAKSFNAEVKVLELTSQFRCNGSDGYIAWLDNILEIKETANKTLDKIAYDFKIFDCPNELHNEIRKLNLINNKARMTAGYCWDWVSKREKDFFDIKIGNKYKERWNLQSDGPGWLAKANSVNEVGCIHTSQGLEVDYIGVIIGDDFKVRNGRVITDPTKRAKTDQSIKGFKKMYALDKEIALEQADKIIKNTYRTLMTRGLKGCYIYCTDQETAQYFKNLMSLQ